MAVMCVIGLLIDLLENLGSWSISRDEMVQLLQLLKVNQQGHMVSLCCQFIKVRHTVSRQFF